MIYNSVNELIEKFGQRRNDPSSQAKMQRMMRNFKIYDHLIQTFEPKLNNVVVPNLTPIPISEVRKSVARLLLYYVKGNELNQKEMTVYLKTLLQDITNKEIPKLCFEIMSSFYREEPVLEYIDFLIKMLKENDSYNYKMKILKTFKALSLDKYGQPIFRNQKKVQSKARSSPS